MGAMLRRIVSPLHDLGYAIDPFLLVRQLAALGVYLDVLSQPVAALCQLAICVVLMCSTCV